MNSAQENPDKELYRQLRRLSWQELWEGEVPRFDSSSPDERAKRVAVIRAIGVVFSESGPPAQKEQVKQWLLRNLSDPSERVRRYAMAALPKIGAGPDAEARLLSLLRAPRPRRHSDREYKFITQALEKIGGTAALQLQMAKPANHEFRPETEQKIKASVARSDNPSAIRFKAVLPNFAGLKIHLRGRRGLEGIVRAEADAFIENHGKFRVERIDKGLVVLSPASPFSLADIYTLRCFGEVGFVPDAAAAPSQTQAASIDALASVIASPPALNVFRSLTEGAIRYRLNFVGKGHQRAAVRALAAKVYALRPEILNDARSVTWTVDIYSAGENYSTDEKASAQFVELRPNLTPDPRFAYRRRDVPAASHPQLAACMARLAGRVPNEIVWDPFCGSGLELIESALLGGVQHIHGTDLSPQAIAITRDNFAAARIVSVPATFSISDFREYASRPLKQNSVSLIITNPPMGMRVPIKNLRGLIADLFTVAAKVLRPGGRLVFANPLSKSHPPRGFQLEYQHAVDFGGFDCRLEKHVKA